MKFQDAINLKKNSTEARDKLKALLEELTKLDENLQENSDLIDKIDLELDAQTKETDKVQDSMILKKSEVHETDKEVEKVLAKIKKIIDALNNYKDIDAEFLDDFGELEEIYQTKQLFNYIFWFAEEKLVIAENELKSAKLHERIQVLKNNKEEQDAAIEKYKQEICEMESDICALKENSEALKKGCFKRTRLEP